MTLERQESIVVGAAAFVLVELLGMLLTGAALTADHYLTGAKPTWQGVAVGAGATTLFATLIALRVYHNQKVGEGYRFAQRERTRGVIDV